MLYNLNVCPRLLETKAAAYPANLQTSINTAQAGEKHAAHLQVIKVSWHVEKGSACVKQLTAREVFARFDFVLKYNEGSLQANAVKIERCATHQLACKAVQMTRLYVSMWLQLHSRITKHYFLE